MNNIRNKVLVIGIDGADFNIIDPLLARGKLQTIRRLIDNGCRGTLVSTIPPITAPALSSFMTGKNPGKHGVFDFIVREGSSYKYNITNGSFIRSKTLWKLLDEGGKKVISINVPYTYPPESIDGIIISSFLAPEGKIYTNPASLTQWLNKRGYVIDYHSLKDKGRSLRQKFNRVMDISEKRLNITLELISSKEWNFFMVFFTGSDRLQHIMWNEKEMISEYYEFIDLAIEKLIKTAGSQCIKIIMSDHGFTDIDGVFYVNEWLKENGLLKAEYKIGKSSGEILDDISDIISKSVIYKRVKEYSSAKLNNILVPVIRSLRFLLHTFRSESLGRRIADNFLSLRNIFQNNLAIDWSRTKAYMLSPCSYGIYINLKDREPMGIVDPGKEYENLRSYIIDKLLALKDPFNGRRLIENACRREEIFCGDYVNLAPDIIFWPIDMRYIPRPISAPYYSNSFIFPNTPSLKSWHSRNGIFFVNGPEIANKKLSSVNIYDIAPTILHIFNLAIPEDMDGRVLKEIFREDSNIYKRRISYAESSQLNSKGVITEYKDRKIIEDNLKALGYIG